MPVQVRNTVLRVIANGQDVPRVVSARIQRGLDQEYAKAQFTVSYPAHGQLKKGSHVYIVMGTGFPIRFVGFIKDPGTQLWPGRITFDCVDIMGYLDAYYPPGDVSFNNTTDTGIINSILDFAQIPTNLRDISGIGDIFGNFDSDVPGIEWPQLESALSAIRDIDEMTPDHRTYGRTNGVLTRHSVPTHPGQQASKLFTEGVNIMSGTMQVSEYEPTTEVSVFTNDGGFFTAVSTGNSYAWLDRPFAVRHAGVQNVNATPGFITSENIGQSLLNRLARNLVKVSFTTEDEDVLDVLNTIRVDSIHLYVVQNFYIQNLSIETDPSGKFRQTITGVSELSDNPDGFPVQVAFGPNAGQTLTPPTTVLTPPSNSDVHAEFTIIAIDKEKLADSSYMYVVTCSSMATSDQGTITDLDWGATGTGVTIPSGSEVTFTTSFTDLAGAEISLQATDSNGNVNSTTQRPASAGVPIRIRKLYNITATEFEAFDGEDWNTHTPSNAENMTAIAAGPYAAAGDMILFTSNDLHTPATEVIIQAGVDITAVWVEPDVSLYNVAAGFIDGTIAISGDGGNTWTVKAGPGGDPILRIITSRFQEGEIHVITDTGYYVSDNYGDGWRLIRSGSFIDLQLSHTRNILVTAAGGMINATNGTVFTFPSLSPAIVIQAATVHIRQDKFYAIDDQGRSFQQFGNPSGSYAMNQGVDIPEGVGQPRGSYRDGLLVDMVYFGTGISLYKTIDGFRSNEGYLKLR